jgi:glycosyltransferase involved in cell wall biosynthesis
MERRGEFLNAVAPSITIHSLDCTRVRQALVRLIRYFRQRQPDVTLVHMWPLTSVAVLAWRLAGKPGKLFVCEHVGLSDHVRRDLRTPLPVVQALLRLSHPSATGVVAVSRGVAQDLAHLAGLLEQQVAVIYNPVVPAALSPPSQKPDPQTRKKHWGAQFRTHLVTVGTLKPQKNHRLLLQAFAQVATELDAALVILGEGFLRATLEGDVQDLGLKGRVVLPGFQADPTPWYQMADLFVLSSDFEGFANVVPEALACGTPVVSTDCPHGPAEILEHGRYGELVPVGDADALAAGIRLALCRHWDREALQRRALDFSIPMQAQAYLDLFNRP